VSIAARVDEVRKRVRVAAERAGRDPAEVTLVAIAKGFGADLVAEVLSTGVRDIGENRAQELTRKRAALGERARWHFVGPLQKNKVRSVVGASALIHSIDRTEVAAAVGRRAASHGVTQDVLIEVNLSGEPGKHGCKPDQVGELAERVAGVEGVVLKGLMAMPPQPADPEESRPYFKELASLRDHLVDEHPGGTELSMGMTRDFEVAVEEGATLIRVGEAIFGPRDR
jgi:pyridoxal phosphate enzyme (YggS family)